MKSRSLVGNRFNPGDLVEFVDCFDYDNELAIIICYMPDTISLSYQVYNIGTLTYERWNEQYIQLAKINPIK